MTTRPQPLSADPFATRSLATFASDLRAGRITAEAAARACLDRIALLNPRLDAFIHVAAERALARAREVDHLLASGTDLGPLMGVPVAIKDLFAVRGMPAGAGSRLDVSAAIGAQGGFVAALDRAGCVILGKTRTTEFALGSYNLTHPVPWNPWSPQLHRMPSGSSHGSAVAQAAGLCGIAIGTDTGGSVRLPAAYCGTVGFKPGPELWPKDGLFPLSPGLDSIGLFTNSAADAALAFAVLTGAAEPQEAPPRRLRLGRPVNYFFEQLDRAVDDAVGRALSRLEAAGVELVPIEVPHLDAVMGYFTFAGPAALIATLGRARMERDFHLIDPITQARIKPGFDVDPERLTALARDRERLARAADDAMRGLDGWVTPTTPLLAAAYAPIAAGIGAADWVARNSRNTRPINVFGLCALSLPVGGADLPVGLQIVAPARSEPKLLAVARAVETVLGAPRKPDMTAFLG